MSTRKSVNNAKPRIGTTCKNAAVSLSAGLIFLTLGTGALLSFLLNAPFFDDLRNGIRGLFGVLCGLYTLLTIWLGVLLTAGAWHPVSRRGFFCVLAGSLMLSAALDLLSHTPDGTSFMDYVEKNAGIWQSSFSSLTHVCQSAYVQGMNLGNGTGYVGMLIAYPLRLLLGSLVGGILCVCGFVVMLFVLFRTNPMRVFNGLSDRLEARRQKRFEARQERARQEAEAPAIRKAPARQVPPARPASGSYRASGAASWSAGDKDWDDIYDVNAEPVSPVPDAYDTEPAEVSPVMPVRTHAGTFSRPAGGVIAPPETAPSSNRTKQKHTGPAAAESLYEKEPFSVQNEPFRAQQEAPFASEASFQMTEDEEMPRSSSDSEPYAPVLPPEEEDVTVYDDSPSARKEKYAAASLKPETASGAPAPQPMFPPSSSPASDLEEQEEEEDARNVAWEDLRRRSREKVSVGRMASSDRPKEVHTDPVMPLTNEVISITPKDPVVTGDPSKRGMDGHEHQAPQGIQIKMDLPVAYNPPPMDLLAAPVKQSKDTGEEDRYRAERIVETLQSFNIPSDVKYVLHGPAVTQFALQISPGIKVSSVLSVQDNIGLQLGTKTVRMEVPIQGTNYIGIETPNASVTTVSLREVLESDAMKNSTNPLMVALGKDIAGNPVLCDLSKMPHLLIAGETGSGKSVCINSIICSILYNASPEEVRLIMVDPKQVELQCYNGIPHLLVPVVCEPKKAAAVLGWAVTEMEERYRKLSKSNTRNITGYNKLMKGTGETLPNIVIIIDEMADLMLTCRKEVEEYVNRLAALARAAGIYMVVATQRPSVDVITGVIKNNIPSRIAFSVSAGTDSRIILDTTGAEKLVGKGDMLYKPTGKEPLRVQGCYLSDEEVNDIAQYVRTRYQPSYNPDIQEQLDNVRSNEPEGEEPDDVPAVSGDSDSFDDLLEQAIMMAVEDEQTSTSMLQRRLRVGYARAGRLIDEMEKRGIISKSEGSKPRKTLITREEYIRMVQESEGN